MTKEYFLPRTRSIVIGVVLMLMGLSPVYFIALIDHSLEAGLSFFISMFTGFPQIILGLIFSVVLISGFIYLYNSGRIPRLKLDEKGVYYLPWGEEVPSKYRPLFTLFYLKAKLMFIPYRDISFAENISDKLWGDAVVIQLKDGSNRQIRTAPFTSADRQEVVALINSKTNG
ncbi:hypothetical protein [Mucilaginibacter sp.]|uniref:hypothetical protein n=1 Tax=Mucilaginibacter sp. TaxID=1882438 RepID=UPI0035BBB888